MPAVTAAGEPRLRPSGEVGGPSSFAGMPPLAAGQGEEDAAALPAALTGFRLGGDDQAALSRRGEDAYPRAVPTTRCHVEVLEAVTGTSACPASAADVGPGEGRAGHRPTWTTVTCSRGQSRPGRVPGSRLSGANRDDTPDNAALPGVRISRPPWPEGAPSPPTRPNETPMEATIGIRYM